MTKHAKKIYFLSSSLQMGGAERVLSTLSLNLPKNIKQTIILFEPDIYYPYNGEKVILNTPKTNNFFLKIYYFFKRIYKIKKTLNKEKEKVIISFVRNSNIFNALINQDAILTIHNFQSIDIPNNLYGIIQKIMIKLFYNRAKKIIAVSKAIKKDLITNFNIKKDKIKVIYNPIDFKKIQEKSKEKIKHPFFNNKNNKIILGCGRLIKRKNFSNLIKAFKRVNNNIPETKLIILGKGEERKNLKQLIKELNLQNKVNLIGAVKNPYKYMSQSDLFALPSNWEGFPMVLIEAMACGTQIVSTNCPSGPYEALKAGKYGELVPVKNYKKLAQAIIKTLNKPSIKEEAIKKRAKDFDSKKIVNKYLKTIKKLNL